MGITQKELGEQIGVAEVTINKWSADNESIPKQGIKSINLLIENTKLKKDLAIIEAFKNYIKDC